MSKNLVRSVDLIFFRDDKNGEYGLTHKDTYNNRYGASFNATWNAQMIFHDVFEHSHEYSKYFMGDYAMNVGGEMSAMGALCYYVYDLGLSIRLKSSFDSVDAIINTTKSFIDEAISSGYCEYGNALLSNVPTQRPTNSSILEDLIDRYCYEIKSYDLKNEYHYSESERQFSFDYYNSISRKKIRDLHRYGYRMAKKLVPDNNYNNQILHDFYTFWSGFTVAWQSEEMSNHYNGITFNIYKENGIISWEAIFDIKPCIEYYYPDGSELTEKIVGNKNGIKDYARRSAQEVY